MRGKLVKCNLCIYNCWLRFKCFWRFCNALGTDDKKEPQPAISFEIQITEQHSIRKIYLNHECVIGNPLWWFTIYKFTSILIIFTRMHTLVDSKIRISSICTYLDCITKSTFAYYNHNFHIIVNALTKIIMTTMCLCASVSYVYWSLCVLCILWVLFTQTLNDV